jgi:trehalose-6-phosphate synthase
MTRTELARPLLYRPGGRDHPRANDLIVATGRPLPAQPKGIDAAIGSSLRRRNGVWITASGTVAEAATDEVRTVPGPGPNSATAVMLTRADLSGYDAGMSEATLWRLFHGAIAEPQFSADWWRSYVSVNRRFADTAKRLASTDGTVWVHGHRLQLVPGMLRRARPDLAIGYTSQLPFPPQELFARLPWRRQILQGLAAADLIGLPRHCDVTNFVAADHRFGTGTCRPTTAGCAAPDAATTACQDGPVIRPLTFPGWVDARTQEHAARQPGTQAHSRRLLAALSNPETVLLSVDPLDRTRGILHRLDAIAALLADGRLDASTTVCVQIALPTHRDQTGTLRRQVEATVARINGTYAGIGRPVVHYVHQVPDPQELAALYLIADVLVTTPLSEGTSDAAQEYVACRHDGLGALVLSEFSGSAEAFPEALVVNPHDTGALQSAIARAVTLTPDEATRRMHALRRRLFARDLNRAVSTFLDGVTRTRTSRMGLPARATEVR